MTLSSGTRLGRYEVISLLGAGGMGEVYLARDSTLSRTVAIKVLASGGGVNGDSRARFRREAMAIAGLQHPNICVLHDVVEDDGIDFLVMEHLEGETLAMRLAQGPLPLHEALRLAREIGSGLAAAHRQGVVHRDLKPANVMLTVKSSARAATAKLLDFGLAKTQAGLDSVHTRTAITSPGFVVGTMAYMSPEQMEGREADARSDIFALGAILYEMTTGKRASSDPTTTALDRGSAPPLFIQDRPQVPRAGAGQPMAERRGSRRRPSVGPRRTTERWSRAARRISASPSLDRRRLVDSRRRVRAWRDASAVRPAGCTSVPGFRGSAGRHDVHAA